MVHIDIQCFLFLTLDIDGGYELFRPALFVYASPSLRQTLVVRIVSVAAVCVFLFCRYIPAPALPFSKCPWTLGYTVAALVSRII